MSFSQPPKQPGNHGNPPFGGEAGTPAGPPPGQETWGQPPLHQMATAQPRPTSKPLLVALCIGLFLSGCVSGCVTGAAIMDNNSGVSPMPTATVTVTANASQPETKNTAPTKPASASPSEASPDPTGTAPTAPTPPAPQAPAPQPPDPSSLTQPVDQGTITITPFVARTDELTGKHALLCTTVTAANTSNATWSVNPLEFELSTPEHKRINAALFTGGQNLGHSELIAGDTVVGDVCFEDPGTRGQFTLIWGPFFSDSTRWTVEIP